MELIWIKPARIDTLPQIHSERAGISRQDWRSVLEENC